MLSIIFMVISHGSPEYYEAVRLREEVLRKPLGIVFLPGELEKEKDSVHIVGLQGNKVVATVMLTPDGDGFKMRQVVVKAGLQGAGVGSQMMQFCELYAKKLGAHSIYCHARDTAVNFYLKNGYTAEGDYFEEVTIPHLKMKKVLL